MSKLEKLLVEIVSISYANMVFNTLAAKYVAAALANLTSSPKNFDKDIDEAYKTIDDYVSQLNDVIGGKPDGR